MILGAGRLRYSAKALRTAAAQAALDSAIRDSEARREKRRSASQLSWSSPIEDQIPAPSPAM